MHRPAEIRSRLGSLVMFPLYFGTSTRALYGAYTSLRKGAMLAAASWSATPLGESTTTHIESCGHWP